MKKKLPKKLSLSRETLAQLENSHLADAAGGATRLDCTITVAVDSCCPRSSCYC